jgi:hypothetical protein
LRDLDFYDCHFTLSLIDAHRASRPAEPVERARSLRRAASTMTAGRITC